MQSGRARAWKVLSIYSISSYSVSRFSDTCMVLPSVSANVVFRLADCNNLQIVPLDMPIL